MEDFDNDTHYDMSGLTATAVNCGGAIYGKCDNLHGDAKRQCQYNACRAAGPCHYIKDPVTHHYRCRGECNVYSPGLQGDCFHHDVSVTWRIGARAPDDMCPDAAPGEDGDGDGIEDACDPDRFFKETYVAAGDKSGRYPTTPPSNIIDDAWTSMYPSHWDPTVPRQGFLDADRDGVPEGEDFCPVDPSGGYPYFDDNSWGEDQNWPWTTDSAAPPFHTAGELHRGNPCDPYPLGITEVVPEASSGSACSDRSRHVIAGDNAPRYTIYEEAGTSVNGATVNGEVDGQTYRCACRDKVTLQPIADCLDSERSDCFRRDVQVVTDLSKTTGYGNLPLERESCSYDANGFCAPYPIDSAEKSWVWHYEHSNHDPPEPAHFGTNDFVTVKAGGVNEESFIQSRYEYAIMTLTSIKKAPAKDQQFGSDPSPFPDPRFVSTDDINKNLWDPTSAESKRLRVNFAGELQLTEEHRALIPPLICNDPFHLGFDAVWTQVKCIVGCDPLDFSKWWEDGDPFQLVRNDTTLSGLVLVRPAEGYTSSIVADDIAQELLGSSSVLAAPMPTGPAAAGPDLMVLGTNRAGTSWLRLAQGFALGDVGGLLGAPTAAAFVAPATAPSTGYYTVDSGQLPVPLAEGSRLLSDPRSDWVGLFVPGWGVWGYNPLTGSWRNAGAPPEVVSRGEPALAMVGSALVVAGGVTEAGAATDAWAVSLAGHGAQLLSQSLPPRRSALLTVKADASGFAYEAASTTPASRATISGASIASRPARCRHGSWRPIQDAASRSRPTPQGSISRRSAAGRGSTGSIRPRPQA